MSNKVGVLILHGIGRQQPDYSIKLQQGVEEKLAKNGSAKQVVFREVLYAPLFENYARKRSPYLMDTSAKWQLLSRSLRGLLIFVFGDATSYKDREGYIAVQEHLSKEIEVLKQLLDSDSPIIVAAHSMGAMVISDYVYDEQNGINNTRIKKTTITNDLRAFITFGCNIPLFEMGHKKTVSIAKPTDAFVWKNFFSPFDVLGYRISRYYDEEHHAGERPAFISDERVFAGGIFAAWNIFSHLGYWNCGKVHTAIVEAFE